MNIILTGHKGLIGSVLKKRLEKEGHNIVLCIDKRDGGNIDELNFFKFDLKIDMVIHMADFCKINKSIENPELVFENARNYEIVFEFCRKNNIPNVVFFSSSRILSKDKNPYTATKIYGEELCKAYKDCYDIDSIIIRPSTVYGSFWDLTERLIHKFIVNALTGKNLQIYGDPETKTLDFTHVEDFVEGIMLIIKSNQWNIDFNISGNQEENVYGLAKFIINETNSNSKIEICDAEIAQPQKVRVDISEIQKLGYFPKISLKEGVRDCINWYKNYMKNNNLI